MMYVRMRDARPNLSKMIRDINKTKQVYVIGVRNTPRAVLVDIETAEKYLPKEKVAKGSKETGGERFVRLAQLWMTKHPASESGRREDLSKNIDKIVYGI